jgi:hypothetical protein
MRRCISADGFNRSAGDCGAASGMESLMNPPDRPRADLPPRSRIRGLARHVLPDAPTGSRTPRRVGPQIRMPGNLHAKILSRKSREDERSQAKNAYEPGWDARQRFLFVSRIATNYLVKEPFHTQWKREPSTQSQSQSLVPGHSTLPILHQDAWHALACLSPPMPRSFSTDPFIGIDGFPIIPDAQPKQARDICQFCLDQLALKLQF